MSGGAEESDATLLTDKGERTGLVNIASTEISEKETFRARFTEEMVGAGVSSRELLRVQKLQDNKGGRLMSLLTDFHHFPWAQETVVTAAQLDEVLVLFLQQHLDIDGETLRRWTDNHTLHLRALQSLAQYEATHLPALLPDIKDLVDQYKAQAWGTTNPSRVEVETDCFVESSRRLTGDKAETTMENPKPPKPLGKNTGKRTRAKGSKRGRGRANILVRKRPRKPRKTKAEKPAKKGKKSTVPMEEKIQKAKSPSPENRSDTSRGNSRSRDRGREQHRSKRRENRRRSSSRRSKSNHKRRRSRSTESRNYRRADKRRRSRTDSPEEKVLTRDKKRWRRNHSREDSRRGRELPKDRGKGRKKRTSRGRSWDRRNSRGSSDYKPRGRRSPE